MSGYEAHVEQDRRLVVLRLLAKAPGYSSNDSILHGGLDTVGHRVSRDQVRTDLSWLAEQGLVKVEDLKGVCVARLTERGNDVAAGRVTVPGVKHPSPKD